MTSDQGLVTCDRHVDRRNGSLLLLCAVLFWGTSIAAGFAGFMNYETTAGAQGNSGELWPTNSHLQRTPGRFSIVMVAHPRCPCTRASLATLRELSESCQSRATIDVLFWMPRDAGPEWSQTALWRDATAISAAHIHPDVAGLEAERFGAATSGQVLVYDPAGRCVFRGGITNSRGKFGDSDGANAIGYVISSPSPAPMKTRVFGCPLSPSQDPGDQKAHRVLNCP